jgi:hypothetical protein
LAGEKHHIQYVPEPPSISTTFVVWSALGSLLLVAIVIGGFYGLYRAAVPTANYPAATKFPQPRVDTKENEELRRIRAAQQQKLETWGWSDAGHTLVKIPIERAMQLLAAKGKDAYSPLLQPQAALSPPTAAAERATIQHQDTESRTSPNSAPETPK